MGLLFRRSSLVALLPLILILAALVGIFLADISLPSIARLADNPNLILGFYAATYPLLALALFYAAMRLLMVALTGNRPFLLIRLALWLPAVLVLLIAGLYPTFGGLIARAGFGLGGILLTHDMPPQMALLFGGAMAGAMLGLMTGIGHAIIDWDWRLNFGRVLRGILAVGAFKWAGIVLLFGWQAIADGALWPKAAMQGSTLLMVAAMLAVAFLPHVLVSWWSDRARRLSA